MSLRRQAALLGSALAFACLCGLPAVAASQEAAARAGSNAGSSSITPTHAAAPKRMKRAKPVGRHRLPVNTTGMGSQAANATGATSNSH